MLKPLSHDPQSQGLDLGLGLSTVRTIGQNTRQIRHFRDPPTILFLLELDVEPHTRSYVLILARFPSDATGLMTIALDSARTSVYRQRGYET